MEFGWRVRALSALAVTIVSCSDDPTNSPPPPPPDFAPSDTLVVIPSGGASVEMRGGIVVELRSSAIDVGSAVGLSSREGTAEPLAADFSLRSDVLSIDLKAEDVVSAPGSLLDSVLSVSLPIEELAGAGPAGAVAVVALADGSRLPLVSRVTAEISEIEVPIRPALLLASLGDRLPPELSFEVFVLEAENSWQSSDPSDIVGLGVSTTQPWFMYEIADAQMDLSAWRQPFPDEGTIPVVLVHGWNFGFDPWVALPTYDPADKIREYWLELATLFFDGGSGDWPDHFDLFAFRYDEKERVAQSGAWLAEAVETVFPGGRVIVVAHSMGGLVARSAMVESGADSTIHALVTLATPHHGSPLAIVPGGLPAPMGESVLDLAPDGELAGDLDLNPTLAALNGADGLVDRYVVYREMFEPAAVERDPALAVGDALLRAHYEERGAPEEAGSDGVVPHGSAELRGLGGGTRGGDFASGGDHASVRGDEDNSTIGQGVLLDLVELAYPTTPASPQPADRAVKVDPSVELAWSDCDRFETGEMRYKLYLGESDDPGLWVEVGPEHSFAVQLDGSLQYYWRIEAIDAQGDVSAGPLWTFGTANPPVVTITNPGDGSVFEKWDEIAFAGSAVDDEDGVLTGASLVWRSSLDGAIGTGGSFAYSDLSVGDHAIRLSATDSDQATGADTISVTIDPGPPPLVPPMVEIDAGIFWMGSASDEPGRSADESRRLVFLTQGFRIGASEITQAEWGSAMGSSPSHFDGCDECPVELVSWYGAVRYCNALSIAEGLTPAYANEGAEVEWIEGADGYHLPTEAEWEFACRAGSETAFFNGGIEETGCGIDANLDEIGWYCGNSGDATRPRRGKEPNDWGLYDTSGNVAEWCWDWYGDYPAGQETDPTGPSYGSSRVRRGAGWADAARSCRSAKRGSTAPDFASHLVGFRVVRSTP